MDKSIEAAARAMYRYHNLREASNDAWRLYESEARAAIAAYRDAEIERLTQDDESWPSPRYAQEIVFEGCACLAIAPEEYEALYNAHADLRAKLEAAERDAERYREWRRAFREGECGLWNALCEANSDAEHDAAIDSSRGGEHG